MKPPKRGLFTRKTYESYLYTWTPEKGEYKKNRKGENAVVTNDTPRFCNATARSQGEDWVVTYVYELVIDGLVPRRLAYVACDYVR